MKKIIAVVLSLSLLCSVCFLVLAQTKTWLDFEAATSVNLGNYAYRYGAEYSFGDFELSLDTDVKDSGQSLKIVPKKRDGLTSLSILIINPSSAIGNRTGDEGIQFWCSLTSGYNAPESSPNYMDVSVEFDMPSRVHFIPGSVFYLTDNSDHIMQAYVLNDKKIRIPMGFTGKVNIPLSSMELDVSSSSPIDISNITHGYIFVDNNIFKDQFLYIDTISTYKDLVLPSTGVTGISLNKTATTIDINEKETLIPTIEPDTATNRFVTWSSNKPEIATVSSSGVVRGVSAGTANITATTVDGNKTAVCVVTVTSTIVTNSINIENFDSVADDAALRTKAMIFDLGAPIDFSLNTQYKDSGAKSLKLVPQGANANGDKSGVFIMGIDSSAKDMTDASGVRFWVKTTGGTATSERDPNYISFQIHFDMGARIQTAIGAPFYMTTSNGITSAGTINNRNCLSLPDGFEGEISIPFSSFGLTNITQTINYQNLSRMYVYIDCELFKDKDLLIDTIRSYDSYDLPVISTVERSANTPVNVIENFDDYANTSAFRPVGGASLDLGLMDFELSSQYKHSGSNSLKLVPKGINANGFNTGCFAMGINNSVKDWSTAEGVQFWVKTTGGTATGAGDPSVIQLGVQFDFGTRVQLKIGEPYYITYPDGSVLDDVISSDNTIIIMDGFEGIISFPMSSFSLTDKEQTIDLTNVSTMYLYIDCGEYKNKDIYIDTIKTYDAASKPVVGETANYDDQDSQGTGTGGPDTPGTFDMGILIYFIPILLSSVGVFAVYKKKKRLLFNQKK